MVDYARVALSTQKIARVEARLAFQKEFIRRLPSRTDVFSAAMENDFMMQIEGRLAALRVGHSDLLQQLGLTP